MSDMQGGARLIGGRYRVTGTLGHGGMASVYSAVDEQLGRQVAVKVFRMGAVDHGERARAESEIQVLAGLRNPALVTLYDAAIGDDDGDSYLVMELVPGSDLATRLRQGTLDPSTAARVGAQVSEGLAAVHAKGIVHRDIKPANVLLEADDTVLGGVRVKLADFGIALLRDSARVTGTGTVMGTAAYIAPEQVLGHEITGKADVYGLGLMLLESLSGTQAFPGTAVESATARLTRGPAIDQHLPTAWRTLLHVMTATDPAERPTAVEAAERLRALGRDDVAPPTALLPGGPVAAAGAGAAAGVAGAAAADATRAMGEPTRMMPAASAGDDATRRMDQVPDRSQDDFATTVLGTQGASAGGGGDGGRPYRAAAGPAGPRPPSFAAAEQADARRRTRGWIIVAVVVGVLVVAGILFAVFGLGGGGSTPAPTDSTSPSQQQEQPSDEPSQPSDESSEPTEQQPQPSVPEQQPSEPEEQPSEPDDVPSQGPEPSSPASLPVETPATGAGATDTSVGTGPGSSGRGDAAPAKNDGAPAKGDAAPGNSGNAPGHDRG